MLIRDALPVVTKAIMDFRSPARVRYISSHFAHDEDVQRGGHA